MSAVSNMGGGDYAFTVTPTQTGEHMYFIYGYVRSIDAAAGLPLRMRATPILGTGLRKRPEPRLP